MNFVNSSRLTAAGSHTRKIRILAALWAVLSLAFGFLSMLQLSMMGFPDGYLSPYDQDIQGPAGYLVWACFIQGFCFLVIGFRPGRMTLLRLGFGILIAACLIVVPLHLVWYCPSSAACTFVYERVFDNDMDSGQGG